MKKKITVHGLGYVLKNINCDDSLLIIDDVYDSGLSIAAVLDTLRGKARKNMPEDIRIATIYYKPKNNKTNREPDYYIHETNFWLIFPHEIAGLTREEILKNKSGLKKIMGVDLNENNKGIYKKNPQD